MQEFTRDLELCSQEGSENAVGPGEIARYTDAIFPEAMGSGGLFSFVNPKVKDWKVGLTWNSLDMCGGPWGIVVVDIYSGYRG